MRHSYTCELLKASVRRQNAPSLDGRMVWHRDVPNAKMETEGERVPCMRQLNTSNSLRVVVQDVFPSPLEAPTVTWCESKQVGKLLASNNVSRQNLSLAAALA